MDLKPGATVALTECPAVTNGNHPARISGLWVVEEYLPYEPANYVHEPVYVLAPESGDEEACVEVLARDLIEQADPRRHGEALRQERAFEHYCEDRC
jgi:hypothetical protein